MKFLAKDIVVPAGSKPRTFYVGLGRGLVMHQDLRRGDLRRILGVYEAELVRTVQKMWQPGRTTFDVGTADGYYSLVFAKRTRARVLAFECDDAIADRARRNLALNPGLSPLVELRQDFVGIGGVPGQVSLDDVADGTFVPDLIKMDIEGGEVDALQGASRVLARRRPDLLIEVHGAAVEVDCIKILQSFGYVPQIINARRWLPEHRPIPHNRWLAAFGDSRA